MSLQEVLAEQRAIRGEILRLQERLNNNDARIEGLMVGGGGGGSAQRGGYPAYSAPVAAPTYSAPPPVYAAPPAARPAAPASPFGVSKPAQAGIGMNKGALEAAVQASAAKAEEPWEEPPQMKTSMSEIDRCETHLKEAFMKHPALSKKATTNPLQALTGLLNGLDTNHTGKLDIAEFKEVCRYLKFSASDSALTGLFHRYDLDRSNYLTVNEFGQMLLKEGGTETKAKTCIAKMREVLSLRAGGFPTMKAMGSQFRIIDRDRSGTLSREEFNIALDILFKAYKVTFSVAEKNSLFAHFDKTKSGGVNYDEYIRAVRGDMNEFRIGWVQKAFNVLDKDGSGVVTMDDIASSYDVSQNPAVKSGKQAPNEAYTVFMNNYDANQDGKVTLDEFIENYNWVSASIDNDDYFELMIRNAWHISGGEGWCQNTANLRVLVEHFDGGQEVVEIIDDLGLDKRDYSAVMRKLTGQGVKDIKGFKLSS